MFGADWGTIKDIADNVSTMILLVGVVYVFFSGRVPTPSEHRELRRLSELQLAAKDAEMTARLAEQERLWQLRLEEVRKSEDRAWATAAKANDALAANNTVIDRSTDAIQNLSRLLESRGRR